MNKMSDKQVRKMVEWLERPASKGEQTYQQNARHQQIDVKKLEEPFHKHRTSGW